MESHISSFEVRGGAGCWAALLFELGGKLRGFCGTTGLTFLQSPISWGGGPTPTAPTALLYALCSERGIWRGAAVPPMLPADLCAVIAAVYAS
jgi:hypothetical protein